MTAIDRVNCGSMKPGQELVVAGYVGSKGASIAAQYKRKELLQWFTGDFIEKIINYQELTLCGDLEHWKRFGATECEMIGEGGAMTALWNLSGAYKVGIEFTLRQIPVKQETIEICERYNLNPFRLLSADCLLLAADNGESLVKVLEQQGIHAAVIGKVNSGIKREIHNGESRGFLDRPKKDELKKVVPIYDKIIQEV